MTLKILSYNIRFGGGGREDQIAAVIRMSEPDLVILQEATEARVVERLAQATGMTLWASRSGYSVGFMSRIEIDHHEWHPLPKVRHALLEIVLKKGGIRVFGLHLSAIHSHWTEQRRVRELRTLLESIKQHQSGLHVLLGDFNTLAPGELLDMSLLPLRLRPLVWLSGGYIRWETIQIMLDAGYVDGYRFVNPLEKGFTFPTWNPHLRLDYVFVPAPFSDRLIRCQVRDGAEGKSASDHFPISADLEVD